MDFKPDKEGRWLSRATVLFNFLNTTRKKEGEQANERENRNDRVSARERREREERELHARTEQNRQGLGLALGKLAS